MFPALSDFAPSVSLDNALLRQSVVSGEVIPAGEILSLAATAQAIFISVTLESRALAHVKDRHRVWAEAAGLFAELCACWTDVDSTESSGSVDDMQIHWLSHRLRHFRDLALEQTRLYSISETERRRHARDRGASVESFGVRSEITPNGYSDQSSPAHVYHYSLPRAARC